LSFCDGILTTEYCIVTWQYTGYCNRYRNK